MNTLQKLADFRKLQNALEQQQKIFNEMQGDPQIQDAIKFTKDLHAFLKKHDKSIADAILALNPLASALQVDSFLCAGTATTTRYYKPLKRYVNPHSGEVVESKGGSNKTLMKWKRQWGRSVVATWVAD